MPKTMEPSNTKRRYEVSSADMPVCCPMPDQAVWNSHPRVYLPFEESKEAVCPYCEAHFFLVD